MVIFDFSAKIKKVEKISEDVLIFTLTVPEDFNYKPGQFIILKVKSGEETKSRSYSILSAGTGKIKLCIKLLPGGFASEVFFNTKEGDKFDIKGPLGHFVYEGSENKEIWLLGGGTGIVPLCSIVEENLSKFPDNKFVVVFSARTEKDLFLQKEFKELEQKHDNFVYLPTLTRQEWGGKRGRIPRHLPEDLKNKTFYICGTKELVLDIKKHLLEKGVNLKDIKFERFS